ncbi:uncharacterized protein LOC126665137 [Mercurialis annua]|uniref:uncharacterized protein LOC126665137 n=1 Tax=Mercurialis annua TaxID=3986 RepID=UPI00215EED2B|nr:uncharacterized protein LOC126665137 [Mercurialis annua]
MIAGSNGLATNQNLHLRIPSKSALCPRCTSSESQEHIFLLCPFAEAIWLGSELNEWSRNLPKASVRLFWNALVDRLAAQADKMNLLAKCVLLFWSIWRAQNALIFSDIDSDPMVVIQAAINFGIDFSAISNQQVRTRVRAECTAVWTPPPLHVFKINFDGAYLKESLEGVGACVVRDHTGRVSHSCARRFTNVTSPAMIKALALREAILLAHRIRLINPIFEGDAKTIIEAAGSDASAGGDCDVIIAYVSVLVIIALSLNTEIVIGWLMT